MSLHSSKVIAAVVTGLTAALTGKAEVLDGESRQQDVGTGLVVVQHGEIGEPQVFLSPRSYGYEHAITLDVTAPSRGEVDTILGLIRDWIEADRSLGGLTDWLDVEAPQTGGAETFGSAGHPYALVELVASYTTPSPLS